MERSRQGYPDAARQGHSARTPSPRCEARQPARNPPARRGALHGQAQLRKVRRQAESELSAVSWAGFLLDAMKTARNPISINLTDSIVSRFWERTQVPDDPNRCWLWKGATDIPGYGVLLESRTRSYRAHRVSWTIKNGPIPDSLMLCHRCDVRNCVNPDHLFLGTRRDNLDDMVKKGRQSASCGENHYLSKLTQKQVVFILNQWRRKQMSQAQLSAKFGVCQGAISRIVNGKGWQRALRVNKIKERTTNGI